MKKLLLILLCLPIFCFGQKSLSQYIVVDTVVLVDKMEYMQGYDLTFKSLTTLKKLSFYIDYAKNEIETKTTLKDILIVFDHIGWGNSNISWDHVIIDNKYVITYYLKKYRRPFYDDITWGSETVIGNHIIDILALEKK